MKPKFICIVLSGNSGAGKSTLLRVVSEALRKATGFAVEAVSERELHHPLLINMFRDPETWALPIQLNFVLQRATRLMQAARRVPGRIVVMERCLDEDRLFFDYYVTRKCICPASEQFYESMRLHFVQAVPRPGLVVHLRACSAFLIQRLERALKGGTRPVELDGERLREYIEAMNERYRGWSHIAALKCGTYWESQVDSEEFDPVGLVQRVEAFVSRSLSDET